MNCPVCIQVRLEPLEREHSPRRLVCSQCGGSWIQSFQYWKWLQAHGPNLPERPPLPGEPAPAPDSTAAKICPECGHILTRRPVGHGVPFQVDRCTTCGGIWLDRNEWDILERRNLHDDIHLIFSAVWQHELAQEDRRKTYESRLQALLSQADFQKVRDFKTWALAHPRQGTILAFLAEKE